MKQDEQQTEHDMDQMRVYHIRLQGHLSRQGMDWWEGFNITLEEDGNTLLSGSVADQAALHGILKKVRDLGVVLLSVNSANADRSTGAEVDSVHGDFY